MAKRKKKWIQKARRRMKRKGTEGSFTRWCRRKGFDGVTEACIRQGLNSDNETIRRKAQFAKAMRSSRKKGPKARTTKRTKRSNR